MNKKGFTLVELLATIIILALLAVLASTSVTKVIKESKGDLYTTQIELVKSAAEAWGAENIPLLPEAGECKYITLKYLQDYGLIDKDIKNPKTNKEIDNSIKIKISSKLTGYGNSTTDYEVNPESIEGCEVADLIVPVGTEVVCGTEKFNVIQQDNTAHDVDSTTLTLFAQGLINMSTATPGQTTEVNTAPFLLYIDNSTEYYWDDSDIGKFVYNEKTDLYQFVNAYENYLRTTLSINNAKASLISYKQANELPDEPWVYMDNIPQIWTGTASSVDGIWSFGFNEGKLEMMENTYPGHATLCVVRPVVIIPKSEIGDSCTIDISY